MSVLDVVPLVVSLPQPSFRAEHNNPPTPYPMLGDAPKDGWGGETTSGTTSRYIFLTNEN